MFLEWAEHSQCILRGVNGLKAFYDVTLSAEGKEIKAHRVILAAASTYFNVSKLFNKRTAVLLGS